MTFTRDQLAAFTGRTLPDLIPHPTRLLIVGINPGLLTVAVQAHFARRGNRFYKALHLAGITDHVIDASNGFDPADVRQLEELGIGITCIVPEATARAAELAPARLTEGGLALRERVAALRPTVVAILGISAYRVAFDARTAAVGRQGDWGDSQVWVVPNPSGLNAHSTLDDLASAYREVAVAAGIPVRP
ncbi:mismatch-specific DNA-glycosylase [Leifsonia sp. NPDC077715]|uniref:mismatch-specific DNA-glycosylase n=1 Tax=Leifsonia sp. NPDC077715 TaxID=3155539 RepID=UPI00343C3216